VIDRLKRALRKDQQLTVAEFNQLLQLAKAILDYGRMIQAYRESSVPYVIVEIPELALRFRETPRTIKDALLLLEEKGLADPVELPGCWKLKLAGTLLSGREDVGAA
jgi:hypothetical protein